MKKLPTFYELQRLITTYIETEPVNATLGFMNTDDIFISYFFTDSLYYRFIYWSSPYGFLDKKQFVLHILHFLI
jgi:hypothetical protein